jgi:hypothetical protein
MEPKGCGVLDTRFRGYDDLLQSGVGAIVRHSPSGKNNPSRSQPDNKPVAANMFAVASLLFLQSTRHLF